VFPKFYAQLNVPNYKLRAVPLNGLLIVPPSAGQTIIYVL